MSDAPTGRLERLIARLTGRLQLERIAALEARVSKFGRAQREELASQRTVLDHIAAAISTRAGAGDLRALERRVEHVQTSIVRQDRAVCEALERARRFDEQAIDDRRFARRIESFLRHDRPIVVGPWTGEVGFELLYWVPFVRWVAATYRIPPERLVVVSRGGVAAWYEGLAGRYVDVFSHFSPEEFRAATEDAKKQRRVGEFDARVVERIMAAHGLARAALLHPGMMYRLFWPVWKELATASRVDAYTKYERLTGPADPVLNELPAEFVAARFYFSECFPDTPANRTFVTSAIEAIGAHTPVVLLNTPFAVDDHRDVGRLDAGSAGTVLTIERHMAPERNLAVQTAVISRARAFVGTYGGYSYLAPMCGVSSLAFYSAHTFKEHHLHIAQRAIERLGTATLVPLDVAALPLVRLVLPGVTVAAR
jgi:hypothetical protein